MLKLWTYLGENETRKMYGVLEIDLREDAGKELVRRINESFDLLPDLKLLSIRYIDENNEGIKHLLSNGIEKSQSLFFNNFVLSEYRTDKVDISNYMEWIMNVLPRIQKEAYFYYMKINAKQLVTIIKNWAHIKRVGFIKCKLNINSTMDLDTGTESYEIKSLNLKGCGEGFRGGILKHADFEKIITGRFLQLT